MNDRIVIDPKVCHGKPVVRGTRMPVSLIVGSLAGGMNFEDVQREYALTLEDIRAALKFAGELVEQEQHHPLPGRAAPMTQTCPGQRREPFSGLATMRSMFET